MKWLKGFISYNEMLVIKIIFAVVVLVVLAVIGWLGK
jgi:hypothetical protein